MICCSNISIDVFDDMSMWISYSYKPKMLTLRENSQRPNLIVDDSWFVLTKLVFRDFPEKGYQDLHLVIDIYIWEPACSCKGSAP